MEKRQQFVMGEAETGKYYRECLDAFRSAEGIAEHIIDAHCHIYPDGIAAKAIHAIDKFYEGIPAEPCVGDVSTLLRVGKKQGIDRFVVHSVATGASQVHSINAFIARSVQEAEGLFIGLGTLFPESPDTEKDFENLRSLGLRGVKIHPDIQKFDADCPWAMGVYEMCESEGVPICVHTGDFRYDYSNPPRVARVLRRFPNLKFIGAHFGGWSVWDEAAAELADFPNLIVDTSSSFYWMTPERAKEIIRAYGSERVMFGTDYPMWSRRPELEYLRRLDISQEEKEDICWRTCSRLFEEIMI